MMAKDRDSSKPEKCYNINNNLLNVVVKLREEKVAKNEDKE